MTVRIGAALGGLYRPLPRHHAGSAGKPPNNQADHELVISQCNIDIAPHH
jgi:hypothetical protein